MLGLWYLFPSCSWSELGFRVSGLRVTFEGIAGLYGADTRKDVLCVFFRSIVTEMHMEPHACCVAQDSTVVCCWAAY